MSDILKKVKMPIIIILLLVVGFFVYNKMIKKDPPSDELSDAGDNTAERRAPNQDFLPLLNLIKGVSFDSKFFDDPLFKSLIDFSEPVREEQKGRDNPFAPGIVTSFTNTAGDGVVFGAVEASSTPATTTPRAAATTTNAAR